jgi:hypothetical protein
MRENSDAQFAPITRMFLERQRTDVNEGDTYRFGLPLRQFHTTNGFYCYISDSVSDPSQPAFNTDLCVTVRRQPLRKSRVAPIFATSTVFCLTICLSRWRANRPF